MNISPINSFKTIYFCAAAKSKTIDNEEKEPSDSKFCLLMMNADN